MIRPQKPDIDAIFREGVEIDRAIARAARAARIENKRMGIPLLVWSGGRIVRIPPDEIVIDPDPDESSNRS
jgi:hypothetical protein